MKIPLVDLKTQYSSIKNEVKEAIDKILEDMNLFLGENVQRLEDEFAAYSGVKYGIGVGSGTEALHLVLLACDIGEGDEVITTPFTFFATVEAIRYTGAKPVFVDINPQTYCLDINKIKEKITERTKAIVPVHLYGQCAEMDALLDLAKENNLSVIEDSAQAHGAEYKGEKAGSLGEASCFSFYFSKNLGAYGEGGMVLTNNQKIADKIKLLRNHGQGTKFEYVLIGYNSRLDEIQAAILRIKLKKLDKWNALRRKHAQFYTELLKDVNVICPQEEEKRKHIFHLYVIRTQKRDELREWLSTKGIATGIHYAIPLHLQRALCDLGYKEGDFPVAEKYAQEVLTLPMYPELKDRQIEYITECIKKFFIDKKRDRVNENSTYGSAGTVRE